MNQNIAQENFDILIRGGSVFDGTGSDAEQYDIGIRNDRIIAVGDLRTSHGNHEIDADGLRVAPGFIDIHTHSDISVTYDPDQASAIGMGVTTQVTGNCSLSFGFVNESPVFEFEQRWLAPHKAKINWDSFDGFLKQIEERGVSTNFIPLAGNGSLRKRVVGMEDRAATPSEMQEMRALLEEAMQAGVWGLSSGLEYTPSSYATVAELADLCKVVAKYGGFYATHLRNEGDMLVEAVQEAIDVVELAGLPLQLSHHKAEGQHNWGKIKTTLAMVDAARSRGIDVQLDQYPYTAFMTSLAVQILPPWARSGTSEETSIRLVDLEQRAAIRREILDSHPEWADISAFSPWVGIQIGVCRGRHEIQGRNIAELAHEAGVSPIDFVLDLLVQTKGYVSAVNFAIGEVDIAEVMRHPWTSIGSDGVGTHPGGPASEDKIHPRAYGTFPRVLGRYVRELGVITEAQAIHKMTGLPAARMGLADRGKIAPGCFADLTIYDPKTVGDLATFDEPHQFATGISTVLVNGRVALDHAGPNTARAGRVLRHR